MEKTMQPTAERKRIHPHKFAMWMGIGSIMMMFAGLTSAYIVRESQGNWVYYKLPVIFWVSTLAILISSITLALGVRAFKNRAMPRYRMLVTTTLILGVLFAICQLVGFNQ